ncbi:MAG TPA: Stp1/IreP family PP2C-type Ser/Thr phosphatase [Herpetosiphon sp.]|uniref:Protein serine/threonine phosphatase n=1 Tax=Herpetosiphon aurantiacus (strain ATCC 23779 / DSM 785 / 114-95) TaxID=316274 RepID=A9B6V6_HERA2|nr:Stp1/IreP family PP2C-type Ser/Thr phosphatase [Herpetosiphon sp.]ABX05824.1 protein serine/threonine phosphatase [Herpetosiphon aurantiacus DSM 785]HBW48751.1 Stp1/IreP family PP2C-type Ser/Thr phosphatase [Herpetosiphon sp.]
MKLRHSAQTDIGRSREVNQDAYGVGDPLPNGIQLFVVCDGMGGHLAGEVASQTAVQTMLATFPNVVQSDIPKALTTAIVSANQAVFDRGRGNMGTTSVALLIFKNVAFLANVGDSRAYLIRNNAMRQITVDHSFVEEQVRAGLMTREQASQSKIKNIITRAVGHQREVQVDVFREPVQAGDRFLISSDGLHGFVDEATILKTINTLPFEQIVPRLIDLANGVGGYDNITALLVQVDELEAIADNDPLLETLLNQPLTGPLRSAEPITEEFELPVGPTGTAPMPVAGMRDDETQQHVPITASGRLNPAMAAIPTSAARPTPTTAPKPAGGGLSGWGILGSLVVLAALVGVLYIFKLPPVSLLFPDTTSTPNQIVVAVPSLMPTTQPTTTLAPITNAPLATATSGISPTLQQPTPTP